MINDLDMKKLEATFAPAVESNILYEEANDDDTKGSHHHKHAQFDEEEEETI